MAKPTRCPKKTKDGKRCKAMCLPGRKSCVAHAPKRKKKAKAKKSRPKKTRSKAKAGPKPTRCPRKTKDGKRCKAMCLPGRKTCVAHKRKTAPKAKPKKRRSVGSSMGINTPPSWAW